MFVVHLISWPAAVGFLCTVALAGTANYFVMKKQHDLTLQVNEYKDKRSKKLTEIFQGIRVVKMFTWEQKFQQNVRDIIETENKAHRTLAWLNSMAGMYKTLSLINRY